ncbi:MAG: D-alanyl-D-alanine carboxypeptidase, partial [Muribaculaceae bacterium]|nr:D-alanyl-D-alanine carboxypeptidase [Muribaculaceae bacterium]
MRIKSILLTLLLSCLMTSGLSAGVREQEAVDRFISARGLPENMAVMVTDLATGETVCAANEKRPLVPASIMKTVTIASLSRESDVTKGLETKVYIDGDVRDGILR